MTCKYLDCGYGECIYPERCPYLKSQMTEKEQIEGEIKILQAKLELLKEIETYKSQPKMEFSFGGKFEVVCYNEMVYYRLEFPDEVYWYRRIIDDTCLDLKLVRITDGETHRLLDGLWFNEVRKGKYDDVTTTEPYKNVRAYWGEKDNPNLQKIIDEMVEERKSQKLLNIIREWCDDDNQPTCEELLNRIEKWLPKPQNSSGSQNAYVECSVEGFNDALQKIKENLR